MSEMLGLEEMIMRYRSRFNTIDLRDINELEASERMKYVRGRLHDTLKFLEFEVVSWKALIPRNLAWSA